MKKAIGKYMKFSNLQIRSHLQTLLTRKGFDWDIIEQAVSRTMETIEDRHEAEAIKIQGDKAWRKYQGEQKEKRNLKIKQYLYRKGFQLDDIEKFLLEKESEAGE